MVVLAGVRLRMLDLLKCASTSGTLEKPLPVERLIYRLIASGDRNLTQTDYVLFDNEKQATLLTSSLKHVWRRKFSRKHNPRILLLE